jgi:hypothetical protein
MSKKLGLSYKNARELNKLLDSMPVDAKWTHQTITIPGTNETHDLFFRDPLKCIKKLYGDPELAEFMKYAPEKHYSDASKGDRIYCEINTGKWWWSKQV